MARLEWSEWALSDLDRLVVAHHLPADARERIESSARPLERLPRFGPEIRTLPDGGELRFLIGLWPWLVIVCLYLESDDRVGVVSIEDGRAATSTITRQRPIHGRAARRPAASCRASILPYPCLLRSGLSLLGTGGEGVVAHGRRVVCRYRAHERTLGPSLLLVVLLIGGYLLLQQTKTSGPTASAVTRVETQAQAAAAGANLQAMAPVLAGWYAGNGTYAGVVLPRGSGVELVRADATSYCFEAIGAATATMHETGPNGSPQLGPC